MNRLKQGFNLKPTSSALRLTPKQDGLGEINCGGSVQTLITFIARMNFHRFVLTRIFVPGYSAQPPRRCPLSSRLANESRVSD